jgi:outer membrane protein TolC
MANLETEKEKLAAVSQLATDLLKFQMGLSSTDELTLSEDLNNLQVDAENITTPKNQTFDYQQRTDFSILQTQQQLQLLEIQQSKNLRYPTVNLFAQGGANIGTLNFGSLFSFNDWYSLFMVGLKVNVPIFNGFKYKHITQQKKLSVLKTENLLTETKRSIDLQQKQAITNFNNAKKQLLIQERNQKLAQDIVEITKTKQKEGVVTHSETWSHYW